MKLFNRINNKGVSLPLVTGIVTLLMISSASVNTMVIRSLRSIQQIEASSKAFMAAEAGIEDALYELSPHLAGYETPEITNPAECPDGNRGCHCRETEPCRASYFEGNPLWNTQWVIDSHSGAETWSGEFYPGDRLLIFLYNDLNTGDNTALGAINTDETNVTTLRLSDFTTLDITFQVPEGYIESNQTVLKIDNDGDFLENGVNEDPEGYGAGHGSCNSAEPTEDEDCDGRLNEDGTNSPLLLWKLTDNAGHNLRPILGKCLTESIADPDTGSEICEKDFKVDNDYSITLGLGTYGINEENDVMTFQQFINDLSIAQQQKIQFEFIFVAPLEHVDTMEIPPKKIEIPYLEYTVASDTDLLPFPYFTILSDGYFNNFKQSLKSTISPRSAVSLFDFTIIQQK